MSNIERFLEVMACLRDPQNGCPWDKEQTPKSIVPHTIEEAYEVAEAIECGEVHDVRDELGDLLFQIVFYAQLYKEADQFDFEDIVNAGIEKIVRRHPHVFADVGMYSLDEQSHAWEAHKASERQQKARQHGRPLSVLHGVSIALPALTRAIKLQKRAAGAGFDWPDIRPVLAKVLEETEEVREELDKGADPERTKHEIGDLLFSVVNLARHVDLDPEASLREANTRFEHRFHRVEQLCAEQTGGLEKSSLEQMERFWEQAKQEE